MMLTDGQYVLHGCVYDGTGRLVAARTDTADAGDPAAEHVLRLESDGAEVEPPPIRLAEQNGFFSFAIPLPSSRLRGTTPRNRRR